MAGGEGMKKEPEFKDAQSKLLAEAKRVYSKLMDLTPEEIESLTSEAVLLTALDYFIRGCEREMNRNNEKGNDINHLETLPPPC